MQKFKKRVFNILQIGYLRDWPSRLFDIFIVLTIFINLFVTLFGTFEEALPYKNTLYAIELITILIFTAEYVLRIWTAEFLYPQKTRKRARLAAIIRGDEAILPKGDVLIQVGDKIVLGAEAYRGHYS